VRRERASPFCACVALDASARGRSSSSLDATMRVLRHVSPRLTLVALVMLGGVLIWRFGGIGVVPAFAISYVLANGFLATLEDDLARGFNSSGGSATPRQAKVVARITRVALLVLCILLAAFLFLSAAGLGLRTGRGFALVCLGLSLPLAYIALTTQRRIALAGLAAMVALALLSAWLSRGV
jgi:hypothetical protein